MPKQREMDDRHGEGQDNDSLRRRRRALIAAFQRYLTITSAELGLASAEETENLRTPLLAMTLEEEGIAQWERFQNLIPLLLHSAQKLHTSIRIALAEAGGLLPQNEAASWQDFFQSPHVGFQEKERRLEDLQRKLAHYQTERDDGKTREKQREDPSVQGKGEERKKERGGGNDERSDMEQSHEKKHELSQRDIVASDRVDGESLPKTRGSPINDLLTLLPTTLRPLYATALSRGSLTLLLVQRAMERSLTYRSMGLTRGLETLLLTREALRNTDEALRTCRASADDGPLIIPEGVTVATQSLTVHGIHGQLLGNLRRIEGEKRDKGQKGYRGDKGGRLTDDI